LSWCVNKEALMKAPEESSTTVVARTLRILVADDHELIRRGLRTMLEVQPGWTVCGEATTGTEAVNKIRQLQPNVAVLDIHMPEMDGLQAAREILAIKPECKILILTLDESAVAVHDAVGAGAHGIVMKSDAARELIAAVSALARQESFYTSRASGLMLESRARPLGATTTDATTSTATLTHRERDVVVLVSQGHSNKEIAAALSISVKTVETHRKNIMHKLGLKSAVDLVRYSILHGLVQP
jgi:DNA-binding NarL/FixJ family response regulator